MTPIENRLSKTSRLLCVDPAGGHLAYTVSTIDQFSSTHVIEDAGIIWVNDSWDRGHKFFYMYQCLKFLIIDLKVDQVFSEAFFVSPKLKVGTSVIPTINNLIRMVIYESGRDIPFEEISPSSWRKKLGITPVKDAKGKRDYKAPTKQAVETRLGITFPDKVISNITGNMRDFPTDIPDALAITIYVSMEYQIKKLALSNNMSYSKYSQELRSLSEK